MRGRAGVVRGRVQAVLPVVAVARLLGTTTVGVLGSRDCIAWMVRGR